ncbi:MAG: hypothetical protein AAGG51_12940 [Cyanobacteria bacterium P01_G01_bin.54]
MSEISENDKQFYRKQYYDNPLDPLYITLPDRQQLVITELEERLNAVEKGLPEKMSEQWSQLVAWSWLSKNNWEQSSGGDAPPGYNQLRRKFIDVVKNLAYYTMLNYYSQDAYFSRPRSEADQASVEFCSLELSKLLTGETEVAGKSLPTLFNTLTGEDLVFATKEIQSGGQSILLANFFWFGIQVDRFTGSCVAYDQNNDRYTLLLAYPPRPEVSENPETINAPLTTSDLYTRIVDGYDEGNPNQNPYIATCNC